MSRFEDPIGCTACLRLAEHLALIDSYHCSGSNWRTGRLTRERFEAVFAGIKSLLA